MLKQTLNYAYMIIGYFILVKAMVVILGKERMDLMCPNGAVEKNMSLCKEGNSKIYHYKKPNKNDSKYKLKNNIFNIQEELRNEVKWRRYVLLGVAIALIYNLFICNRIPSPKELIIFTMFVVIIHKMFDDFFYYHHYKFVHKVIKNNVIKI